MGLWNWLEYNYAKWRASVQKDPSKKTGNYDHPDRKPKDTPPPTDDVKIGPS